MFAEARMPFFGHAFLLIVGAAGVAGGCGQRPQPPPAGVIVLGFDGMDYRLTGRMLREGKLPNLARLAETGGFQPLGTSVPPQSPVAWSDFITGLDAGGHGIFDFIHRRPETMEPYLSTSVTEASHRVLRLGGWRLPLSGGQVRLLRKGTPFWQLLEQRGIPTTVIRIPANFPPSRQARRELSGMGTPDLLGGYGSFTFFTETPDRVSNEVSGGVVVPAVVSDGVFHGRLTGPRNPFRAEEPQTSAPFTVYVDERRPVVKVVLNGREVLLSEGDWSEWLPVEFELIPHLKGLRGICRFYLKRVHPGLELYVTPINLDPLHPAMRISTPPDLAAKLARAGGRFYTQGMPEDTKALTSGVFDRDEFLRQAAMTAAENRRQYERFLSEFSGGLLFYYFGHIDQVSHMMWRPMDPLHPAYDSISDFPYRHVVEELYEGADEIVGQTLERMEPGTLVIVMSDHGFASWRRAFNLNTWLKDHGYLVLRDPSLQGKADFFANVDWSRTRAYGLGLSGLYLNLKGREQFGTVPPGRRRELLDEIATRLLTATDPRGGERLITRVFKRDEYYSDGGAREVGPDLVLGYARGVRGSDESALGRIPRQEVVDNTGEWSGDHIMDPAAVPGVLFSNRPLRRGAASLRELGASVLAEFGIEGFPPPVEPSGSEGE